VIEVHCDSLIRACMPQNVAESSKMLERTSMLTIASVSPALQVQMWTQHEWRDCFRKTGEAQFDSYHRKLSQYCPWRTEILQRLCTLGINMSDWTSQMLTSRDCSFTFLTVYTRKEKRVPIIYSDRRSYTCAPFHSSSKTR